MHINNWIYFLQAESGPVKIGIARSPKDRLRQVQTHTHEEVRLIGVMPGNFKIERELHKRFRAFHIRGEWFNFSEEIQKLIAENPVPDPLYVRPHVDFT